MRVLLQNSHVYVKESEILTLFRNAHNARTLGVIAASLTGATLAQLPMLFAFSNPWLGLAMGGFFILSVALWLKRCQLMKANEKIVKEVESRPLPTV